MLDPGSWTKYYSTFNQTNCHLALKIWVGDPGTVSGHSIPDPDPLHKQNRIQVHNCGSGSESRIPMKVSKRNWIPGWRIQMRTASYEYRKADQLRTVSCGSDLGQLKNRRIKEQCFGSRLDQNMSLDLDPAFGFQAPVPDSRIRNRVRNRIQQ
jgi:hypothetical protein